MNNVDRTHSGAVCLTGDVHHMSLRTRDQLYLEGTEAQAALNYARICDRFDMPLTLFITGKVILEEKEAITSLTRMENLELGGHGYDGFRPLFPYRLSGRLLGLRNGPRFWQRHQVRKTCQLIEDLTGVQTLSWRNHAFHYDKNTAGILNEQRIRFWSDFKRLDSFYPYWYQGLICVPVNTTMDHNTMIHGPRTKEYLEVEARKGAFAVEDVCSPEEWLQRVIKQVYDIVGAGGVATILAHPACMELADGFKTLGKLCGALKGFPLVHMRRIEAMSA